MAMAQPIVLKVDSLQQSFNVNYNDMKFQHK